MIRSEITDLVRTTPMSTIHIKNIDHIISLPPAVKATCRGTISADGKEDVRRFCTHAKRCENAQDLPCASNASILSLSS